MANNVSHSIPWWSVCVTICLSTVCAYVSFPSPMYVYTSFYCDAARLLSTRHCEISSPTGGVANTSPIPTVCSAIVRSRTNQLSNPGYIRTKCSVISLRSLLPSLVPACFYKRIHSRRHGRGVSHHPRYILCCFGSCQQHPLSTLDGTIDIVYSRCEKSPGTVACANH